MNDLTTQDRRERIINGILEGKGTLDLCQELSISEKEVLTVLNRPELLKEVNSLFESNARGMALIALNNIYNLANNDLNAPFLRLRANKILIDIAQGLEARQDVRRNEPSTMSQTELAARLQALQAEVIKRARPTGGEIIEAQAKARDNTLDQMLD